MEVVTRRYLLAKTLKTLKANELFAQSGEKQNQTKTLEVY